MLKLNNKLLAIFLSVLLVSLSGCMETDRDRAENVNVENCKILGGLPVRSHWDGRLVDCIFKPKIKKAH